MAATSFCAHEALLVMHRYQSQPVDEPRRPPCESQINFGSNSIAANIVKTTTAPNATAPNPALIVASDCNWTSATRMATTKMSSMDQRPTCSIIRYIFVRCMGSQTDRRCTEINRKVIASSLADGMRMLAMKTISARCQDPECQR